MERTMSLNREMIKSEVGDVIFDLMVQTEMWKAKAKIYQDLVEGNELDIENLFEKLKETIECGIKSYYLEKFETKVKMSSYVNDKKVDKVQIPRPKGKEKTTKVPSKIHGDTKNCAKKPAGTEQPRYDIADFYDDYEDMVGNRMKRRTMRKYCAKKRLFEESRKVKVPQAAAGTQVQLKGILKCPNDRKRSAKVLKTVHFRI